MLTFAQITAIISLLFAFNVPPATVEQVRLEITPQSASTTSIAIVPVIQSPITQNQPVYFGSTQPTVSQLNTVNSPIMEIPTWRIEVPLIDGNTGNPTTATVKAGTGILKMLIRVYDENGAFQKVPVTITTNDPDMPTSFVLNVPRETSPVGNADYFCVGPWNENMGVCQVPNPVSTGTFDFIFTAEGVSTTTQVTVIP